ncbi:MAG: hypothetical protein Q9225_007639 [Loekoesia sp. 1 TL-2023]
MASDLAKMIADVRSCIVSGALPEDSRQTLLQAAKDLQYDLETSLDTSFDLITTRIFHNIKLFDILIDNGTTPISTDDLAKITNTDPVLLRRLLRFGASIRSVKQVGTDTWTASRLTHNLNVPSSRAHVHEASLIVLAYVAELPRFLAQTNYKNPADPLRTVHHFKFGNEGMHWFDWAKLEQNAEHFEALNELMATTRFAKSGIEVFPFEEKIPSLFKASSEKPESALFVDIGGGRGQMCRAFRNRYPDLPGRVVFQDLPHTIAEAEPRSGIEAMPCNFFEPQPIKGAKIYFIRHVLHDWPDAMVEAILSRLVEAMDSESVLLIDEKVLPAIGASTLAAGLDLQMMSVFAAQERSEKEWENLLGKVGLKIEYLIRYKEEERDTVVLVRKA